MTEIDWMTSCSNRLISHYGYDGETADRTARDAAEEQAYLYGSDPAKWRAGWSVADEMGAGK